MSKMAELAQEIGSLQQEGFDNSQIAKMLCIPVEMIPEQEEVVSYDDLMDGDHASALASAGFGTDEDYGYFGEE